MKPGGGARKGAAFERTVCRKLSLWISNGKNDDLFWRSAMSGGRATIGRKKGLTRSTQVGDLTAIDGKGLGALFLKRFVVECKHIRSLDLDLLTAKQSGAFRKHWEKHLDEANWSKKNPFLIARQNRFPTLLFLDADGLQFFYVNWKPSNGLRNSTDFSDFEQARFFLPSSEVSVFNFEEFLKEIRVNV